MHLKCSLVKSLFFLLLTGLINLSAFCQSLAVNSTGAIANASAIVDISSPSKGMLIPRVNLLSTSDVLTIASPAPGLLVYNLNGSITGLGAGGQGFYYYAGHWYKLLAFDNNGPAWLTIGNDGTVDGVNSIGTSDFVPLNFKAYNKKAGRIDPANQNAFFGSEAGGRYNGSI